MMTMIDISKMSIRAIDWWMDQSAQSRGVYLQALYELETANKTDGSIIVTNCTFADEKKKSDAEQ